MHHVRGLVCRVPGSVLAEYVTIVGIPACRSKRAAAVRRSDPECGALLVLFRRGVPQVPRVLSGFVPIPALRVRPTRGVEARHVS